MALAQKSMEDNLFFFFGSERTMMHNVPVFVHAVSRLLVCLLRDALDLQRQNSSRFPCSMCDQSKVSWRHSQSRTRL